MYLIGKPVLSLIGFLYLRLQYKDKQLIAKIRDEKYNGEYSAAGLVIVLNTIAGIGFLGMVFVILTLIYFMIVNSDLFE
jgi:hypothetical protein